MLTGHATAEGTRAFARGHPSLQFAPLGRTGLRAGAAGFGGYRITAGNPGHERALEAALTGGVNLVDTSTNYADGGSERLVGEVLARLAGNGRLSRDRVIVVSKVGYLQGENYELSRRRSAEGRPFPELVAYADGLEHCIHPAFIADQIDRSLRRLGLETLDVLLLHNPEYYLNDAHRRGVELETARKEFYRRIEAAFDHLESEVERGRIRAYGVSSNTFVAAADDPAFTCLDTLWKIASARGADHRFAVAQLPFNLLEAGAALEANQPGGRTTLETAIGRNLAVLVNRPLNAVSPAGLVRLADIDASPAAAEEEILHALGVLAASEGQLADAVLNGLPVNDAARRQVRDLLQVAGTLLHRRGHFGTYPQWRQARTGYFQPRVGSVMAFLDPLGKDRPELTGWMAAHREALERALDRVESVYRADAHRQAARLHRAVETAEADWAAAGSLSGRALRALRSTAGVSCVLVGMRRAAYVDDVLRELALPVEIRDRTAAWRRLRRTMRS